MDRREEVAATAGALTQTVVSVATFFVVKVALEHLPWLVVLTLRMGGAAVLFAIVLATRPARSRLPRGSDLGKVVLLGLLGVTLNQGAYVVGMSESTPARAALLYGLTPLIVLLIGVGRGLETLVPTRLLGILLAFGGVALVLSDRVAAETRRGDLVLLCGAVFWASYTALGKRLLQTYDTMSVTAIAILAGTAATLPFGLPAVWSADLAAVPGRAWAAVAFMAVFTSFVAYTAWYYAIRRLPPSRVAVFMNLQPPMTFAVAWGLTGEGMSAAFLGGAALALAGVWIAQRRA